MSASAECRPICDRCNRPLIRPIVMTVDEGGKQLVFGVWSCARGCPGFVIRETDEFAADKMQGRVTHDE